MPGPGCSVLYQLSPGVDEAAVLEEFFRLVASDRRGEEDFWVEDTHAIGGSYRGIGQPFFLIREPLPEPKALEGIKSAFGWAPAFQIGLAAMCRGKENHLILAELALWLATKLSGVIDLDGDLPFPSSLSGKVAMVPYDTESGEVTYQVVDCQLLESWLRDPSFTMVN